MLDKANHNRTDDLSEVATLAVKRTDMRYSEDNRDLMKKRIDELVALWHFTGKEVHDQIRAQSN